MTAERDTALMLRCTRMLWRPPYAGAKYTTSFADNAKSRISSQLFGDEVPTGAQRACGETMMVKW